MATLEVELVPETAWWTNVRSNVSRAEWEKCKKWARAKAGNRCSICRVRARRLDCHEIWEYDSWKRVQTLVDLVSLCSLCHGAKHFGHSVHIGRQVAVFEHLARVNGWSHDYTERYLEAVFALWRIRSQHQWELDITFLQRVLES